MASNISPAPVTPNPLSYKPRDPKAPLQKRPRMMNGGWSSLISVTRFPVTAGLLAALIPFATFFIALSFSGIASFVVVCIGLSLVAVSIGFLARQALTILIAEASEILFAPYGVPDRDAAFDLLYNYLVTRFAPILILEAGMPTEKSKESPLFKLGLRGPGFLRVDAKTAVLLKGRDGGVTLREHGEYFFDRHEQVVGWANSSIHRTDFNLNGVYTKDNIPITLKGALYYRVVQKDDVLGRRSKMATSVAVRLVSSIPNWPDTAMVFAYAKMRDFFSELLLNDIHGSYPKEIKHLYSDEGVKPTQNAPSISRNVIQQHLNESLNETLNRWGVEVISVVVQEIRLPPPVEKTLREAWATEWNNQVKYDQVDNGAKVKIREAEGERAAAEIKRVAEILKAQAEGESLRVTTDARTEAMYAYLHRVEMFAKANEIRLNENLLRELLQSTRWMMGATGEKTKNQTELNGRDSAKKDKSKKERAGDDSFEDQEEEE